MSDVRIQRWAEVLVQYSVAVQPGQVVAIQGGIDAEELLRSVYREVLKAGGIPQMLPILPGLQRDLYQIANDDQLTTIGPIERFMRTEADVTIQIMAERNTRALTGIDPTRQSVAMRARAELFKTFLSRSADGSVKWTLTLFPTDAYAQDAGLSSEEYTEFVYEACKLNNPDPVAAWREIGAKQQVLTDWLNNGRSEIHIVGPDTDLTVGIAGRRWENCDGTNNFPDGEIFTGPVETQVNGRVRFSFPVVAYGREIRDIRLTFKDGLITDASAASEEDFLIKTLDTDAGARRLGEFAFGTNFDIQQFSKNILFDEKIGGTIHMAAGSGYPETGSTNESSVHWDMICDLREGGRVTVDGELFMENGKYLLWS
jgi:aminopeptidase